MRVGVGSSEMGEEFRDVGNDVERIRALSDGVFAIVLTLLVLELKLPDKSSMKTSDQFWQMVGHLVPDLIGYAVSFLLIGMAWIIQNRVFRHIVKYDRGVLYLNLLYLLCISFLPFATQAVTTRVPISSAVQVYYFTLFAAYMLMSRIWTYCDHKGYLDPTVTPLFVRFIRARGLVSPTLFLTGIVVAAWNPVVALYVPALIMIGMARVNKHFAKLAHSSTSSASS